MHLIGCKQPVNCENMYVCGEIVFRLDPVPRIVNISSSMLNMMKADLNDKGWINSLHSNINVFLPEKLIKYFLNCCKIARERNLPVYFNHDFYDYHRWLVKSHGWVYYVKELDEYHLVELKDKYFSSEIQSRMYQIVSDMFDGVFELNVDTMLIAPVKIDITDFGMLDARTTLEVFRNVFTDSIVHAESRKNIRKFFKGLESKQRKIPASVEFRAKGKESWYKIYVAECMDDKVLLCISDISHEKQLADIQKRLLTDTTTEILNRAGFEATCEAQFSHADFDDAYNVLVLIELVNLFEHPLTEQEEMLKHAAEAIRKTVNKNDVLARFREDAFILCMHDLSGREELEAKLGNLRQCLKKKVAEEMIPQFRIGYSRCTHNPEKKYHCAFDEAAQALYSASTDGTDNVVDFESMNSVTAKRGVHSVRIHTFGYFDVYVDGLPIQFRHKKAKELLAVLVDRRGGYISNDDGISYLWPEEPSNKSTQARFRKVAMQLKNTLKEYGIDYIIEKSDRERRLVRSFVDCDLFHYLDGDKEYVRLYDGSYMTNYSWSEYSIPGLYTQGD